MRFSRNLFAILGLVLAAPAAAQVVTMLDRSGTVTTGGTSQLVMPTRIGRRALVCQNPITATETLFVNVGAAASTTGGSIELAAGGSLYLASGYAPAGDVFVTAATTGHRFICKEG